MSLNTVLQCYVSRLVLQVAVVQYSGVVGYQSTSTSQLLLRRLLQAQSAESDCELGDTRFKCCGHTHSTSLASQLNSRIAPSC